MRQLFASLLLPLFILLTQQGAVLHEISHLLVGGAAQKQVAVADNPCDLCLAYADMASTAMSNAPRAELLTALVFHHHADSPTFGQDGDSPARRSRGPPTLL